jgi:molybdenum cofactor biosynthesis protein B
VSHIEHQAQSPTSIRCAVLTVSDTRTEATDTGGKAISTLLIEAGHEVVTKRILRDEPMLVQQLILGLIADQEARVQAIITTGGTGITSRDST